MTDEAFSAGVVPGGLTRGYEIKILICYLLYNIKQPVSFDILNEALVGNGLINYFEFAEAVSELKANRNILEDENEKNLFTASEKGGEAAISFEKAVPFSVRKKAMESLKDIIRRKRIAVENKKVITPVKEGFVLTVNVPDTGTDFLELSIFLPSEKDCEIAARNFLENPEELYNTIVEKLLKEPEENGPFD